MEYVIFTFIPCTNLRVIRRGMVSIMSFGLMVLLPKILKKENPTKKIIQILALAALCAVSHFLSMLVFAAPVAKYLYSSLKKIETDIKKAIILYISTGIIALILFPGTESYLLCKFM
jgi:cobalamin synthase